MDTYYIGQIFLWSVPYVPQGWALCDGSELSTSQYQALYSLIGNSYGGTPPATFKVPDLRSLVAVGAQTVSTVGQKTGSATSNVAATGAGLATIGAQNLPSHTHTATFTPSAAPSVNIAVPVVPNPTAMSDTPSSQTYLAAANNKNKSVRLYSTDTPTGTIRPFPASVPSVNGTVTVQAAGQGAATPLDGIAVSGTFSTLQPSLTLNYIICIDGNYPSRP